MSNIDVEKLKQYLLNLKSFVYSEATVDDGLKFIEENVQFILLVNRIYHGLSGHSFYRARSLGENEDPSNIKAHSYPPSNYTSLGRANVPQLPVFYASDCFTTSLLEFLNTGQAKELVYVSEWKLNKGIDLPTFPLGEDPFKVVSNSLEIFKEYDTSIHNAIKEIFETYSILYRLKSNYSFSAAFSYFLLYEFGLYNMIEYPSVVTQGQSTCYAVNSEFFDNNFHLHRVFRVRIHDTFELGDLEGNVNPNVLLTFIDSGKVKDGDIVYSKLTKADKNKFIGFMNLMTEDGKTIRAKQYLENLKKDI